jgi:hypothetical protein
VGLVVVGGAIGLGVGLSSQTLPPDRGTLGPVQATR